MLLWPKIQRIVREDSVEHDVSTLLAVGADGRNVVACWLRGLGSIQIKSYPAG